MSNRYPFTQVTYSYDDEEYDMTLYEDGTVTISSDAGLLGTGKWENKCIEEFSAELSSNIQLGLECELFAKLS